ncbi:MAG: thioredoxin family protein [Saprospiraceae bacterium]
MKNQNSALLTFILALAFAGAQAQKSYGTLYHPEADAASDIEQAVQQAAKEGKHVLLQLGGNWCVWCYRLHDFIEKDAELKTLLDNNYVFCHLNYSKENKNLEVLEELEFPQRFGFPALIVLDDHGNRLHTQDSALLESGKSYDRNKVMGVLQMWTPKALAPETYKR